MQKVPPGGISSSALDYVVHYIQLGHCTPEDNAEGCKVAETSDQSVAGPLAPGAYKAVGYDLCSWAANSICDKAIAESSLIAQEFPNSEAARMYLDNEAKTGHWGMQWQCDQWAVLIIGLPGGDESKVQRALRSAATILNGSRNSDGSAPYTISEVF